MAEYSLSTPTFVPVNSAIPFNETIVKGCCNIHHRANSGIITLKGGNCCNPRRYRVTFHASVLGVAGAIQLELFQNGEPLPETLMAVVPATTQNVWTVSADTLIIADCDCVNITARVIAGATTTVDRANIVITREA